MFHFTHNSFEQSKRLTSTSFLLLNLITMTATPRILGCAMNRNNSAYHRTNIFQPGKSKMTPSTNTAPIQSIRSSSCETCDARERTKKPLDKEQEISSIFRSSPVVDEEEDSDSDDLMALKRATPVFDVDDESPFKRLRRTSSFDEEDERDESDEVRVMSNMLSWSDVLVEGDNGYSVASIMRAR